MSNAVIAISLILIAMLMAVSIILAIYFGTKTGPSGSDNDSISNMISANANQNNNIVNMNTMMDVESLLSTNATGDLLTSPMSTPLSLDDAIEPIYMNSQPRQKEYECLDIVSYAEDDLIIINKDNTLSRKNGNNVVAISSKERFKHVVVFEGYLYLIGIDGNLYKLNASIDTHKHNKWNFDRCVWCDVKNIMYACTTIDESCLWLQTDNEGILYDSELNVVERIDMNYSNVFRIYGKCAKIYKDIDRNINKAAILDHNDILHRTNDSHLMRLINWKPVKLK